CPLLKNYLIQILKSCFSDTDRALSLLEEYCKKLRKPEEQQLKNAVKKVMGIFRSSLFQALLDCVAYVCVSLYVYVLHLCR
uniref:L27-1 domain-containing protein n=1 Tax=Panthera leo TaxID=9689 RepID=A0A8C8XXU4_PANLE